MANTDKNKFITYNNATDINDQLIVKNNKNDIQSNLHNAQGGSTSILPATRSINLNRITS